MIGVVCMAASKKGGWQVLLLIWLVLVVGYPIYYLRPDCDWSYAYWGAPEEIVTSCRSSDNPMHGDEGVYARIFIVRPSVENLACFRGAAYVNSSNMYPMEALLQEYELPGPYSPGNWYGAGTVDYVECGNGLLLLRDYSRNKGGLMSARMNSRRLSDLWQQQPPHVVFFYIWALLGVATLILTPCLLLAVVVFVAVKRFFAALLRRKLS